LIVIDPNENLFTAVQLLLTNRIHRLPVVDFASGNVLYILTHKRILKFLSLYIADLPCPQWMQKTPRELGIGTWDQVEVVKRTSSLIEALNKFITRRVSALPIVDELGKVCEVYAKFDVINLAAEKAYDNLNITVEDAMKHRREWFEGVRNCMESDSLTTVIETIVKAEVHRLVITDEQMHVRGIVSLSDILHFLIIKPTETPPAADDTPSMECG